MLTYRNKYTYNICYLGQLHKNVLRIGYTLEGLYCKRPIQYLAFGNIEPPPPHRPASVNPPPSMRGEDTLAGWRGGGGQ
jgi:hypothetical protein